MRDILAALPQACLWLGSHDGSGLRPLGSDEQPAKKEMKWMTEVVFFIALLHICMPNAAQVITSGEASAFYSDFRCLSQGYTARPEEGSTESMKGSTESAIQHRFGAITQEIIAGRMDLVRYGRARNIGRWVASAKVGLDRSRDVWEALWELVRS